MANGIDWEFLLITNFFLGNIFYSNQSPETLKTFSNMSATSWKFVLFTPLYLVSRSVIFGYGTACHH
jgi:hypothetical protein